MLKKFVQSYLDVILLTLIAVPMGALVGLIDAGFGRVLLWITEIRGEYPYWFIPFLGIIGVFIVWCYQTFGGESMKGMALVFETGHGVRSDIPLRLIPFTIVGTWLTHLFGGSAGREGVAIQIGATVSHRISKYFSRKNSGRILLIAGMAAGFSGLFQTPVAATFFALEVLTVGVLEQEAILPALTGAYTACYVSKWAGLEKFSFALTDSITVNPPLIMKLILIGILFGVTGGVFSLLLHKTKHLAVTLFKTHWIRILVIGIFISITSLLCMSGRYSGLGTNLISMSFSQGIKPWDFILKLLFTTITLSAGFQGGEVTPIFSIGSSFGIVLASLLHLPPAFTAALGYTAVFGSATNTLIAPMIIGVEVFGLNYLPYFVIVCTLAYVFNGNLSIYPLQKLKAENSKS